MWQGIKGGQATENRMHTGIITQSDRIAAARTAALPELRELILAGRCDDGELVEIARDIRIAEQERCAEIGYRTCAETRHVSLGDAVAQAIRSTQ